MIYFDERALEVLRENLKMSPSTWHKVMNPLCGKCLIERGREIIKNLNLEKSNPS